MPRTLDEIREYYPALLERINEDGRRAGWGDGDGDMTLNDISFLLWLIDRQDEVVRAVDRLLSDVMTNDNLHLYEPVAARVTAALAYGTKAQVGDRDLALSILRKLVAEDDGLTTHYVDEEMGVFDCRVDLVPDEQALVRRLKGGR